MTVRPAVRERLGGLRMRLVRDYHATPVWVRLLVVDMVVWLAIVAAAGPNLDSGAGVALGVFIIALVSGTEGSVRLTMRYLSIRPVVDRTDAWIVLGMALVAWALVLFMLYIGILSLRRIAGLAPLDWTPVVTNVFATGLLFIPKFLSVVVERVARALGR